MAFSKQLQVARLDPAEFFASREGWDDLLTRSGADPLFLSYAWQRAWWQTFGVANALEPLFLTVIDADGRCVARAPLFRRRFMQKGLSLRTIEIVGNLWRGPPSMRTEFLGFITDQDCATAANRALLDYIHKDHEWDIAIFSDIDETSPLLADMAVSGLAEHRYRILNRMQSYGIPIKGDFPSYLKGIRPGGRRKIFGQRKRLEQLGHVTVERYGLERFSEFQIELNRLHELRWGQPFFSGVMKTFHEALLSEATADVAAFSVLRLDDRPISALYNIRVGDHEFNLQGGFDASIAPGLSPGKLHWGYHLEQVFDESVRCVDLLLGEGKREDFKRDFAFPERRCMSIQVVRPRALRFAIESRDRWLGARSSKRPLAATGCRRALVLDGHSRAAVETVQSLGRAGLEVHVASELGDSLVRRSRYVANMLQQPAPSDAGSWTDWLKNKVNESEYGLVIPSTETALRLMMTLDETERVRRLSPMPCNASLAVALSKHRTLEIASQLGIAIPRTLVLRRGGAPAMPQSFPAVLKAVESTVIVNGLPVRVEAEIARTPEQAFSFLNQWLSLTDIQIQEYVHGEGVGVECLYFRRQLAWHFTHERVHEMPLTGGGSSYRRSSTPVPCLLEQTKALLDALHWHGVAMVEFKRTHNHRFVLMEINPRLWGSLASAIDAGVNFPVGLWSVAQGVHPGPQPRYRHSYYTRHLPTDIRWSYLNLVADHDDPLLLTKPRLRSLAEFTRPLLFQESWDHFDWCDLRVTTAQVADIGRQGISAIRDKHFRRIAYRRALINHRRLMAELRKPSRDVRSILFLCYGNICRSPLAAALAQRALPGIAVKSSGFHERAGRSPPAKIIEAGKKLGIDLADFKSRSVTEADLMSADLVLVMDLNNHRDLLSRFPQMATKTTLLGFFLDGESGVIPDPYAMDANGVADVGDRIARSVDGLVRTLKPG